MESNSPHKLSGLKTNCGVLHRWPTNTNNSGQMQMKNTVSGTTEGNGHLQGSISEWIWISTQPPSHLLCLWFWPANNHLLDSGAHMSQTLKLIHISWWSCGNLQMQGRTIRFEWEPGKQRGRGNRSHVAGAERGETGTTIPLGGSVFCLWHQSTHPSWEAPMSWALC